MTEYVINTGNYDWTVGGTDANDRTYSEDINVFNQAVAISLSVSLGFGERIKAQALDVAADTRKLEFYNAALTGGVTAGWPPAGSPIPDFFYASTALSDAGVPIAANHVRIGVVSQTGPLDLDFDYNVGQTDEPQLTTSFPEVGYASSADMFDFNEGKLYVTQDGNVFVRQGIYMYAVPYANGKPKQYQPFTTNIPDDAAVQDHLPDMQKAASKLTEMSQGKQAFMQDLIASMNRFFDLATNLLQRDERNRQDIVGHF